VDDNVPDNHDELHYKVGLAQADGKNELATTWAPSDDGDPYPGSTNNVTFNDTSNPNSRSYAQQKTGVSISNISQSSRMMTMNIAVK
jgi:immune inhibitor A